MTNLQKRIRKSNIDVDAHQRVDIFKFYSDNQVVIELIGDSMEPHYTSGTKVRCQEIQSNNWPYIHGGVYAVKCSNALVVKRINQKPRRGIIKLFSDNPSSGENINFPLKSVSNIWKVIRVIDAPVV